MKFMVCYEASYQAREALKVAQKHAEVWGAKIEVIQTVTRELPLKHSQVKEMEDKLEAEVKKEFEGISIEYNAQLLVTSLEAGEQLVKFAEEEKIDQIFLGIQKTSKVGKLLFGSTAQYVILQSPCPVITVKK
ncbi:MAG: universal stress protein [Desulfobacterales bacterium]